MYAEFVAISQSYMITSAVLLVALTLARVSLLQLLVMILGVATSVIWIIQVCLWPDLQPVERIPTLVLAGIFAIGWIVPLLGFTSWHAWRWFKRR